MIVIVAIILLFILYLLYKKYYAIEIEVYNLNKLYGDGENAPRSMYEHKIKGTYDTIKNNKDCSRYLNVGLCLTIHITKNTDTSFVMW